MKKIYLIYDRKLGCVSKATTNCEKATEECNRLNENEFAVRYVVCAHKDFADK